MFKHVAAIMLLLTLPYPALVGATDKEKITEYQQDANEDIVLFFDENTPRFDNFPFDIDETKRLKPKANDFQLINFAPMSNKLGERWAVITVRNNSSGRRFLKSEYIVATFANADQANPIDLNESVDAGETLTKTIFFGVSKFPIVLVEMQP